MDIIVYTTFEGRLVSIVVDDIAFDGDTMSSTVSSVIDILPETNIVVEYSENDWVEKFGNEAELVITDVIEHLFKRFQDSKEIPDIIIL